ncbi:acyl-CoA N-acyltransferase [Auriculariales sp. MPI-PUGE-AT-0066]|nr:acyl-CoA N-acyltransferase [Auriculariales sp. MPI-PUGE-AT-0066]
MLVFATTDRLRLRSYDPGRDEQGLAATFFSVENFRAGTRDYVPMRPKDLSGCITWLNNSLLYAIIETKDGEFAGAVVVEAVGGARNRHGSIAISLVRELQGRGFGTEVMRWLLEHSFNQLGLHRLSLDVLANNERAVAVYKKVGFVEEGRRRKVIWLDGDWIDIVSMGLLDEEWRAGKAQTQTQA